MKWNKGNTRKPQDGWDVNRQSGYDWDEEDSGEFSYEEVSDEEVFEEESMEPEFINVSDDEDGDVEFESLDESNDGFYAQETEYKPEHNTYTSTGREYAQEPEYQADTTSYAFGTEYANEPDLSFDQDDGDLEAMGQAKDSRTNSSYSMDYARDEGYVNEDDGYLPELTEEDLRNGPGGGFLAGYGLSDEDAKPLTLDSDMDLGLMMTTVQDDGNVYESGDDSWNEDTEQDPYLNNAAEARKAQEAQKRRATAYNKRQVYVEDDQEYTNDQVNSDDQGYHDDQAYEDEQGQSYEDGSHQNNGDQDYDGHRFSF